MPDPLAIMGSPPRQLVAEQGDRQAQKHQVRSGY